MPSGSHGARIGALTRRGKYILIELDDTGLLLLHLGMSGRITAGTPAAPPEPHDHVVLTLDDGTVVRFNDARRFGLLDYLARGAGGARIRCSRGSARSRWSRVSTAAI